MPITRITAQEAHDQMEEGVPYVDIRTSMEFEGGHPEGAYHIPFGIHDPASMMMVFNEAFLDVIEAHFDKEAPILIACQAGGRSARAALLLEQKGYTNIMDVGPGWGGGRNAMGMPEPGWHACGLPANTGNGGERSYANLKKGIE